MNIDTNIIKFGSCSRLRLTESQTVFVKNNTAAKITCEVFVPEWNTYAVDEDLGKQKSTFLVFPDSADIKPFETQKFSISFRPDMDDQFYSTEIEFFCYFKTMRSFRLVKDNTLTPPWVLTLRATG